MNRTLAQIGEWDAIRHLTAGLENDPSVMCGPGDDCAVLRLPNAETCDILLTSDPVIEGVHFSSDTAIGQVGHKALGRALSDIAAMGGTPCWALVDLVVSPALEARRLVQLYEGLRRLAARFETRVVGGDLARGEQLEAHVFVVGTVPQGTALRRNGALPGQPIYVTGTLGGSRYGRHLSFVPRVHEGYWLRAQGWASAMIDVSDGLARDLGHLCAASATGADLQPADIPVDAAAEGLNAALQDGEDFELLFALAHGSPAEFETAWATAFALPCTRIGTMTDQPGVLRLVDEAKTVPLHDEGYDHFAPQ